MKLTKISIVMLAAFSCASFANNYIMKVDTGNDELAEWTESSVTTTKWENLGELKDCSPNAFPSNKAIGDSYLHDYQCKQEQSRIVTTIIANDFSGQTQESTSVETKTIDTVDKRTIVVALPLGVENGITIPSVCESWTHTSEQNSNIMKLDQERDCTGETKSALIHELESDIVYTQPKRVAEDFIENQTINRDNQSCKALLAEDSRLPNSWYTLDAGSFACDMTTNGGGWTVIQNRDSYSNFYHGWSSYVNGFGDGYNYWRGLNRIHELTKNGTELYVALRDKDGSNVYAKYSNFKVGDAASKYKLTVSGYSGTAGDSLSGHSGNKFTTKDNDNDTYETGNCAVSYKGAWWYSKCHSSNLNGIYYNGHHDSYADGVDWYYWKGYHYSIPHTKMMVR